MSCAHKAIVIGIDGATFPLFEGWMNGGELPTLSKLLTAGVAGELRSCHPPITSPAWKCYSTGKNPGKLGVFYWRQLLRRENRIVPGGADNLLFRGAKDFWEYLGEAGYRVGIIGVPLTNPPRPLNGFLISGGPFAPEEGYTYPADLQQLLKQRFGYRLHPFEYPSMDTRNKPEIVQDILELINMRFDVAKYLLRNYGLDFLQVTCFYINVLQHRCWREEPVRQAWQLVDGKIAELIDGDYNVVLMSDHGLHPVKRVFYINAWLEREGYLVRRHPGGAVYDHLGRILSTVRLKSLVKAVVPDRMLARVRPPSRRRLVDRTALEDTVDWGASRAFAMPQGPVYLLNCRDAQEYERLRENLTEKLLALADPGSGESVIHRVHRREEIYSGPYLGDAPDLLLEWTPGYEIKDIRPGSSDVFGPSALQADNAPLGIFAACGPELREGLRITAAGLYDLAPTILHMMNVAVPDDMDGRVLNEIFREDSGAAQRSIAFQPGTTDDGGPPLRTASEEEMVRERLRGLGYLE